MKAIKMGVSTLSQQAITIAERIQRALDTLTRAERQLAQAILENYPASGLGPLSALAKDAGVSGPTVLRMVQKLGFKGYPDFQTELREELRDKVKNPISKHDTWTEGAPSGHVLNRFTDAVMENIRHSLAQIEPAAFDAACALIADPKRKIFIVGGRISHTIAEYLFLHMQVIRPDVIHVQSTSNTWPHYVLDMKEGDVVVVFDVRRYENNTLKLSELAHAKGAKIILLTDQWRSPVHALSDICFSSRIVVPSAWDSAVMPLLLVESMISAVQDILWTDTRDRMETLEAIFDQTKMFRKFT
ncbi:transcriptional regulator, RpiR family [Sulfitobacter brevis]|uniref:Transcriptional regulator, RpiR family n=1 Tax=Sulfitobacter brevis TaxID=74348 RepID=A0A1I1UIT6_9RHOB|nr:MurR/RpiR family transcriptional regulator [Sulfitobacter brevis]SFD70741.1 transcriptional regulator, RpiR family [Sulfitobacter brevis]